MINQIKNWFQNYTCKYYTNDPEYNRNILLKAEHCIRVSKIAAAIAVKENFPPADSTIAAIAGLLHDIGRFEQYKQFRTFSDHHSVNHGALGEKIIRESRCLENLSAEEQQTVLESIRYHNCASVPANKPKSITDIIKLIRDADKIDIFRLSYEYFSTRTPDNKNNVIELNVSDEDIISDNIYESIMAGNIAMKKDLKTLNDFKALQMSWIFDINYNESLQIVARHGLLEKIFSTFSSKTEQAEIIYSKTSAFLNRNTPDTALQY